jgi:hypothetical protein
MDIGKPERVIEVEPAIVPFEGDEVYEPSPEPQRESAPAREDRELVPARED